MCDVQLLLLKFPPDGKPKGLCRKDFSRKRTAKLLIVWPSFSVVRFSYY